MYGPDLLSHHYAWFDGKSPAMKVSIITPVFNGDLFMRDAVAAVFAQTRTDWEWIIVNDGSTDGTGAFLDALTDPRIMVVHQANAGVSAARNTALDRVRGDYVTFLDADDVLPADAFRVRSAVLDAQPGVDIVHGSVQVTSRGVPVRRYDPDLRPGPLLQRLARMEEGVFFGTIYMLRREKIGRHRFPVGVTHCEDLIFFLTLAHEADLQYAAVSEVVYEYRVQPQSAMTNLDGLERGYLELVRHSAGLPRIDAAGRMIQQQRVRRILFRSWLRRFRPDRALAALVKLHKAASVSIRGGNGAP